MNDYATTLKGILSSLISEMSESPESFVKNPGKDFTRTRKLPFESVMHLLISMGGNSIYKELLESQGYDVNTATSSAFVQQREKILPSALKFLFNEFTGSFTGAKDYKGYRLFAVDGSSLNIATNSDDSETHFQTHAAKKGYNLLQLDAMYDLCSRLYIDARIHSPRHSNENKSLTDMVACSQIKDKVIVIADRYYESYNNFAHMENKGWLYLIRVRDLGSSGMLSALPLPASSEFDICFDRILTRRNTKEVKAHPNIYRFLPGTSPFDFMDNENAYYPISFRVVRVEIADGVYETLITNLNLSDFPPEELKMLYGMRWGIETSFRELKHTVGLVNFHAKKKEYIIQEIYARMTMYNFAQMITSHVVISQADTKHTYQVNFTVAIHICRHFLRLYFRSNASPLDVEILIRKNILPIRLGRTAKRIIRTKAAVSFVYRVS
jgi:hypothetical protein